MSQNVVTNTPTASEFEGANSTPGNEFGDKSQRPYQSNGADVSKGLAFQYSIDSVTPESLGSGINDANGKPMGPAKGSVPNSGGSAKLSWG